MLSRVAENLFWMGRYLERTEHLARYINVEYFSSLDYSHPRQHELALISIADMIGLPKPDIEGEIDEEQILVTAALDETNPVSILSAIFSARENARSGRDSISEELWEAINNFYHFVKDYPVDVYKTKGLSDFTNNVIRHCSTVRGKIYNTLLHDVGWQFIQLGLHLESASQVVRIMISKLTDIEDVAKLKLGRAMQAQQLDVLLDCIEAKDMCKRYYRLTPSKNDVLEFLLLNSIFPRSVLFRLNSVLSCVRRINKRPEHGKKSIDFTLSKSIVPFQYTELNEIDTTIVEYLDSLLSAIYEISDIIAEEYFK